MKKLFINPKGQPILLDVKPPLIETIGSIVRTSYALISPGTELITIENLKFQNLPILKKLIKSKEFRKRIYSKLRRNPFKLFYKIIKKFKKKQVYKNFSSPSINLKKIGYSCSGFVEKSNVKDFNVGDRVACAGSSHAEVIYSPKNLTVKIPENVSIEEAAFTTLGAIALHGVHRANIKPGDFVGVIGVGLIGALTIQLAKISGARIIGFDLINKRLNLAKKLGAEIICNPLYYNSLNIVNKFTEAHGLDAIIICASSKTPKPLEDALELIRDKGKIVIVGLFPITVSRPKLYYKEADLLISRSYGPGRYDPTYEYNGIDYPKEFVPWTEQRNMELFLQLISQKKINVRSLISDIIPFKDAKKAYNKLKTNPIDTMGILLKITEKADIQIIDKKEELKKRKEKLIVGLIGCGNFPQGTHLPMLLSHPNCKVKGICTRSKDSASHCKEKYKPEFVTTNYKKILKDPDINTVFIYTRHDTHANFSIEALKANKNVYCEKPMGLTVKECYEVYDAVQKYKKKYIIGFNRRFSPLIKKAKALLNNRNNPIMINYRITTSYRPGNHWLNNPKIGGGPLIGEFCHFIDLVLYLINSKPVELIACGGSLSHKNLDVYDSCVVTIKFENDSIGNLIYNDLGGPDIPKERIEIFSGCSSLIIDDFTKLITSGFDSGNLLLNQKDKGHEDEIDNVIRSNLGFIPTLVGVDDAIKAMDLVFKTIESIKNNKIIKI